MARKRGNGEGTIYQKADGLWCAQALVAGRRRTIYGRTRAEVRNKLRTVLGDYDRGILPPSKRISLTEYIQRWIEEDAGTASGRSPWTATGAR